MRAAFSHRRDGPTETSVQAAHWALLQDRAELTPVQARDFANWLAQDEGNLTAYEDALWALDSLSRHAGAPEVMQLRRSALTARRPGRRFWSRVGGGSLAAAVLVGTIWFATPDIFGSDSGGSTTVAAVDPDKAEYLTQIGERSAVTLPDNSVVTLDTASRVRVAFNDKERAVYLLRGQAMFEVAHGKPLPFVVYANGQRIKALGTVFNVRVEGDETRVAMVEGSVRVERRAKEHPSAVPHAKLPSLTLTAGEAIVVLPSRAMLVEPVDARQVSSWTGGMLTFNDTPLSEAVAEINRYTVKPIAIADGKIGSYRISGVFKSNDPEHFARAMTEFLPVAVSKTADGAAVIRAKGQ